MTRLGKSLVTDSEILSLDRLVAEIDASTPRRSCALAAELLAPERLSAAGIGPSEERFLGRARAGDPDARARRVRILLNGYTPPSPEMGKVGAVLGPALVEAGHELVATEAEAEAMVDFTTPAAVVRQHPARARGRRPLRRRDDRLGPGGGRRARRARPGVPVFYAPNFALGAVLMMRFAREASRYFRGRGDHRAPPRDEARRAVGHRPRDRGGDGGRRRRSTPSGCRDSSHTRR